MLQIKGYFNLRERKGLAGLSKLKMSLSLGTIDGSFASILFSSGIEVILSEFF